MEVYDDVYMNIQYDEKNSMIELTWKAETEKLTDALFRKEFEIFTGIVEKYRLKAILTNARMLFFVNPPDTQTWIAETFLPAVHKSGLQKFAFLVSADIFAQITMEQVVDKAHDMLFDTRFFDDEAKAREWLMS